MVYRFRSNAICSTWQCHCCAVRPMWLPPACPAQLQAHKQHAEAFGHHTEAHGVRILIHCLLQHLLPGPGGPQSSLLSWMALISVSDTVKSVRLKLYHLSVSPSQTICGLKVVLVQAVVHAN